MADNELRVSSQFFCNDWHISVLRQTSDQIYQKTLFLILVTFFVVALTTASSTASCRSTVEATSNKKKYESLLIEAGYSKSEARRLLMYGLFDLHRSVTLRSIDQPISLKDFEPVRVYRGLQTNYLEIDFKKQSERYDDISYIEVETYHLALEYALWGRPARDGYHRDLAEEMKEASLSGRKYMEDATLMELKVPRMYIRDVEKGNGLKSLTDIRSVLSSIGRIRNSSWRNLLDYDLPSVDWRQYSWFQRQGRNNAQTLFQY
ncbi:MAG: hypothetical protein KDD61_00780 [Bdellovibrionales bacterium]|nr:hypothetical protein [Bdellovibrionales bacterium]